MISPRLINSVFILQSFISLSSQEQSPGATPCKAQEFQDQFVSSQNKLTGSPIETATQKRIDITKKQLNTMLEILNKKEITTENASQIAHEVYRSQTGGFAGAILSNGAKEEIYKVSKILTAAKQHNLSQEALDELINRMAHLKEGLDVSTDQDGNKIVEDLKATHPNRVAYEASTRFLQALDKASLALPAEKRSALFAAGLENGIAYEMYEKPEDRLAGKISPEAKEVTQNISEIISNLDPETKQAVFKAAGFLMNPSENYAPIRFLEKNLKKGRPAEGETFKKFIAALEGSIDTRAQQKIIKAFFDHANKKYFSTRLDAATLEQLSKLEDPLRLIDPKTKKDEFSKVLEKILETKQDPQQTTSAINTLVNIASVLHKPKFYTGAEPVKYIEPEIFNFTSDQKDTRIQEAISALQTELDKL